MTQEAVVTSFNNNQGKYIGDPCRHSKPVTLETELLHLTKTSNLIQVLKMEGVSYITRTPPSLDQSGPR